LGHLDRLSQLPIGLSVELVRFEEESPLIVVGVEDDHISGNSVASLHLDDVAYFQVFTLYSLKALMPDNIVLFGVRLC
jgi:hypothetical protein